MTKSALRQASTYALAMALAALVTPSLAQAAPPPPQGDTAELSGTSENEDSTNDIVVTATRRDAGINKVPISISALTQDVLTNRGIRSVDDIAYAIPGLSFTSNNDGSETLSVRGIVALGSTATTAYYIDETPIAQLGGGTFSPRYFDIERVEVLRGPQGTLYGASAMGGAVRVITAKPNLTEVEGSVRGEGSFTRRGKENAIIDAAVSIPIIADKLALRITGFYEKNTGWVRKFRPSLSNDPADYADANGTPGVAYGGVAAGTGSRVGQQEIYGGRAALRAKPSDDVTLTASYAWQQRKNDGFNNADTVTALGFDGTDFRQLRIIDEYRTLRSQLANFTVEAALGSVKLTSSTSYEWSRDNAVRDGNSLLFGTVVGFPTFVGLPAAVPRNVQGQAGIAIASFQRKESFTQEVRLVSDNDSPLSWIIGGFYNRTKFRQSQDLPAFGLAQSLVGTPLEGGAPGDSLGGSNSFEPRREFSFFGELGYKLNDKLNATIGIRRYDVKSGAQIGVTGLIGGGAAPNPLTFVNDRGFTYKGLLSYKASEDILLFAGYTTGYRPGGVNPPRLLGDNFDPGFKSDQLAQYELGWKTRFLDRALTINGALFYIDWKGIPTSDTAPSGITFTFNGPKARIYGGELEIVARPTRGLDFTLGLTKLNAKFNGNLVTSNRVIATGDRLPDVPDYTVNAAWNYQWSLGGESTARVGANIAHVSKRTQLSPQKIIVLPGFETVGLSAGVSFGKLDISIFARNVFNEKALIGNDLVGNEISNGIAIEQRRLSYNEPQTFGASFQFKF
jgi:iron complex outermembrane recepter protein